MPTASFGTLFNEQIEPEHTIDRHTLFDLEYTPPDRRTRIALRGAFDRFTFTATYPFSGEPFGQRVAVGQNDVVGSRWTVGGRVTRPLPWQVLIVGAEFIDNVQQNQTSGFRGDRRLSSRPTSSSTQRAVYVQDELKIGRRRHPERRPPLRRLRQFDRITPRTALIVMPSSHQSFKYLYGNAFRAPNMYERNDFYFGAGVAALRPESIDTHELVWERYTSDWLRTSVSTYWYKADR